MKNKILLTLLTISLFIFGFAISANAETVANGTCGTNLTWELDDAGTLTISGTGEMTNWNSNTSVPWYSKSSNIKSVVIENAVTSIGNYAFYKCTGLTSVTIGNGVTSIGDRAFRYCSSLTNVTIGNGVTSIGDYAFYECTGLTSVTIPDSVTSIGKYAFYGCSSLTNVYITDIIKWCNISFAVSSANPLYYATNLYLNNELVTDLVIPDSVTSIGDHAFYRCTGLTSVTIPDSVTSIGNSAFSACDSLTDVYYNGTKEDWNKISIGSYNTELTDATIHFEVETEENLPDAWGSNFKYLDENKNVQSEYKGKRIIGFGKNPSSTPWESGKYGIKIGKYYYPGRTPAEANGLFAIVIVDTSDSDAFSDSYTYSIWTGDSNKGESFLTEIQTSLTAIVEEIK